MRIGYCRISTSEGNQSLDLQKDALMKEGVDTRHLFEDQASGTKDSRPGLKTALDYLQAGDCLVVWKIDRLGRSLRHLVNIVTMLKEKGVGFKSITENFDTTSPQGEFFFNVMGSLAQYEQALIRERIMAGLEAAKKRGRKGGRPRLVDAEKQKAILQALEAGTTKASLCRTFGIKRSTLYDALKRHLHSGNADHKCRRGAGAVPLKNG